MVKTYSFLKTFSQREGKIHDILYLINNKISIQVYSKFYCTLNPTISISYFDEIRDCPSWNNVYSRIHKKRPQGFLFIPNQPNSNHIILFRIFTPSNYKPSPIPHFSEIALLSFYVQYKNKCVFFLCLVSMNKNKMILSWIGLTWRSLKLIYPHITITFIHT